MFPGMGKMNPKQMGAMLKQFGIQSEELKANRVVFETDEGKIIIDSPQVTAMKMSGQTIYSVVGEAKKETALFSDDDVAMVAQQTGRSKADAKKALEGSKGDLAEAIMALKE
jgi:nascent polypeptide-associated complex subunit alpha